jgi:hypothetical protein
MTEDELLVHLAALQAADRDRVLIERVIIGPDGKEIRRVRRFPHPPIVVNSGKSPSSTRSEDDEDRAPSVGRGEPDP